MEARTGVLAVLDEILGLEGRARTFRTDTVLVGAVPELDSMAVVGVIAALEERFGIAFDDDDIDASTFATVGSLVDLVERKMSTAAG